MAVAELQQRDEHRVEIPALVGRAVFKPRRVFLIRAALEDAGVGEPFQAQRQHVGGDAEAGANLVETPQAQEDVA